MDVPMSMTQQSAGSFSITKHLKEIGVNYNEREQREILLHWQENGHLPACVMEQSITLTKTVFAKPVKPAKSRNFRYTLEEVTALILYGSIKGGVCKATNPTYHQSDEFPSTTIPTNG